MKSITKITIPQPCHQQWQQMTATPGGRHCSSCAKTVVDFSFMSNDQIIAHLSNAKNVCGKFTDRQLENVNSQLLAQNQQNSHWYKRLMLATALFSALPFLKSAAQSKPETAQSPVDKKIDNAPIILGKVLPQRDTAKVITGKIIDGNNKEVLPGVTIQVNGSHTGVYTDVNGNFRLTVSAFPVTLRVAFIGYETQMVTIKSQQEASNIQLKEMSSLLGGIVGGIVIVKTPFYKKWYWRFVKRPIRKIFG